LDIKIITLYDSPSSFHLLDVDDDIEDRKNFLDEGSFLQE